MNDYTEEVGKKLISVHAHVEKANTWTRALRRKMRKGSGAKIDSDLDKRLGVAIAHIARGATAVYNANQLADGDTPEDIESRRSGIAQPGMARGLLEQVREISAALQKDAEAAIAALGDRPHAGVVWMPDLETEIHYMQKMGNLLTRITAAEAREIDGESSDE